jgi:hypothetical protein
MASRTSFFMQVVWLILAAAAAVGCVSIDSIRTEEFIAVCPNETTGTVAVLTETDQLVSRVDVYRILDGSIGEIWPAARTSELLPEDSIALVRCKVEHLASWEVDSRIEGMWPIDAVGSVLTAEWRAWGPTGSSLVMRDGSGSVLWKASASDLFPPEERTQHDWTAHTYDWIDTIAVLPKSNEVLVVGRGGVVKAIGVQSGAVRKSLWAIVDE